MASRSAAATIQRVQGRKNYHALADYLREQILSGSIPEGAPLPNERDLGGQAGLSRGSVREALRVLEVEGLVSTRAGRNGGSTTRRPDPAGVSRSLAAFIRGQRIPFDSVLETREVLEPALAALAAVNRSAADLDEIAAAAAALVEAGSDNGLFIAANSRWHWAVAEASGNPVLVAMVAAVGDLLNRSNVERFVSAEVRDAVIRAHGSVEAAIRARDVDAAYRRMLRHVRTYRRQVKPLAPGSIVIAEPTL
jgi:GntR family transcriptional repressor for pyruvate dehydrogenase complex